MDDNRKNEQKPISKGRGSMLLQLVKMKQSESTTESPSMTPSTSFSQSISDSPSPHQISADTSNIPTNVGRGRANLIGLLKATKLGELSGPTTPASVSRGRASLLNLVKPDRPGRESVIPQRVDTPPAVSTKVLGKLSDLSIKDDKPTTTVPYQPPKPISRQGTGGKPLQLKTNYVNLKVEPGKGLFMYEVKFHPDIDSRPIRRKLLNQHLTTLGRTKIFDGALLYLPQKIPQDRAILKSSHPMDGSEITLTLIYKKEQSMAENLSFFNVLLGRCMRALNLVRIGQHNYNPKCIQSVPQHRLEVWPGYVTAINEYEGGLKLCIDARHRVMRTETVYDLLVSARKSPNFKNDVAREIIGMSVFTRYNNKMYKIDDIDWDKNPTYTFEKQNQKISLIDYYKSHWSLQIYDSEQPLLVNRAKDKLPTGETQEKLILLIPELCYIAGLTDSIRSDFKIRKDLDVVTKVSPNSRREVIKQFVQQVRKNELAQEIFSEWGLSFEDGLTTFTGRVLPSEEIHFGNNIIFTPSAQRPAEWSAKACTSTVLRTPNLNRWCIIYCHKDTRSTSEFVEMLKKVSKPMGMVVSDPKMICIRDDRTPTYIHELRNNINENMNLMVIVFPSSRSDKYNAVKRLCCIEMPIPSQVIISRTISRGDKLKSVTEKIALQINCKVGGALWALRIPLENCMVCGIDVYHSGGGQPCKKSIAGFVSSLDRLLTTWHSNVCIQEPNQEIVDLLQMCLISAIKAYYKHNARYPDRIFIYRDGVGEGQLEIVSKYEVKQIEATFKLIEPNYAPKLSIIIVHKRINTRCFASYNTDLQNPPPGTVVDTCVTKPNRYDFFLVSQNVRQGTVSPTYYIVIHDTTNESAETIQRLTYKLCHLYYNWPGTIKVPAPCQYAHKLVYLVGQSLEREPHQSLSNSLFYL